MASCICEVNYVVRLLCGASDLLGLLGVRGLRDWLGLLEFASLPCFAWHASFACVT